MPMRRYEIRNEYGLGDAELYRSADKDDPEVLLEGIAMAGLVGVLRQLGDLAEFAAEIFYDLHEDVMATAARGHDLMARVQQLEAEVPFMEKSFVSQSNHNSCVINSGVEWRANRQIQQNLIAGDVPRFVMDSCEECRGPPRLFLLDKFDVAGAGACLKRYSDPAFFKVEAESAGRPAFDTQREKKSRKLKQKKASRWKHEESQEITNASNSKLHQLFSKDRVEHGPSDSSRLVKLKRRPLMGSQIDSKSGKSYKEQLLELILDENNAIVFADSAESSVALFLDNSSESGIDIHEIREISPKNFGEENDVMSLATVREERSEALHMIDMNEGSVDRTLFNARDINSENDTDESSIKIPVTADGKTESSVDGIHSEDFSSEIDNYMDALNSVESENETDNEFRTKVNETLLIVEKHETVFGKNHGHVDAHRTSDYQSVGSSSVPLERKYAVTRGGSFSSNDSFSQLEEDTVSYTEDAADEFLFGNNPSVNMVDVSMDSSYVNTTETSVLNAPSDDHNLYDPGETSCNGQSPLAETSDNCSNSESLIEDPNKFLKSQMVTFRFGLNYQSNEANESVKTISNGYDRDNVSSRQPVDPTQNECLPVAALIFDNLMQDTGSAAGSANSAAIADVQPSGPLLGSLDFDVIQKPDFMNHSDPAITEDYMEVKSESLYTEEQNHADTSNAYDSNESSGLIDEAVELGKNSTLLPLGSLSVSFDDLCEVRSLPEPMGQVAESTTSEDHLLLDEVDLSTVEYLNESMDALHGKEAFPFVPSVSKPVDASSSSAFTFSPDHILPLPNGEICDVKGSHIDSILTHDTKFGSSGISLEYESYILKFASLDDNYVLDTNNSLFDESAQLTEETFETRNLPNKGGFIAGQEEKNSEQTTKSVVEAETAVSGVNSVACSPQYAESHHLTTEDTQNFETILGDTIFVSNDVPSTVPTVNCPFSQLEQLSMNVDCLDSAHIEHSGNYSEQHKEGIEITGCFPQPGAPKMFMFPPGSSRDPSLQDQGCERMEDLPPLPPLPPMQWRMNKPLGGSVSASKESPDHCLDNILISSPFNSHLESMPSTGIIDPSPSLIGSTVKESAKPLDLSDVSSIEQKMNIPDNENDLQDLNVELSKPPRISPALSDEQLAHALDALDKQELQCAPIISTQAEEVVLPSTIGDETTEFDNKDQQFTPTISTPVPLNSSPMLDMDQSTSTSDLEITKRNTDNLGSDEIIDCDNSSRHLTEAETRPSNIAMPMDGDKSWSTSSMTLPPTYGVGKLSGGKKPLPRNPLMDAVAALDKTKLRKVTEVVRPQTVPKLEERDSLLEQIRTKSFNLKPASTARPSIQSIPGPKTNLKVAAILQKANAIRQALAGSDEDEDSDSWSDS